MNQFGRGEGTSAESSLWHLFPLNFSILALTRPVRTTPLSFGEGGGEVPKENENISKKIISKTSF
jgi:hypothetical protein